MGGNAHCYYDVLTATFVTQNVHRQKNKIGFGLELRNGITRRGTFSGAAKNFDWPSVLLFA